MPNGLDIPVGSLAVEVAAATEALDRAMAEEIPATSRAGGEKAGAAFSEGFRAKAEVEDIVARELEAISGQTARRFGRIFERRMAGIRERFARGVIDRAQFETEGREAARRFNVGILGEIRELRASGQLGPDAFVALTDSLKLAGVRGGREFGREATRGAKAELQGISRFMRGGFRAGVVGAVIGIAAAVVLIFRKMARDIAAILQRAGEATALREAFTNLTTARGLAPGGTLRELRRATRGMVDDLELMRRANKLLQSEIPVTVEGLGQLFELGRRLGRSVGVDAAEGVRRFVEFVQTGERAQLQALGVTLDLEAAYKDYADELGTTASRLSEAEKQQARLNAVLEAGEVAVSRLGTESLTGADRLAQLNTAVDNFKTRAAEAIASTPVLVAFLDSLGESASRSGDRIEQLAIKVGAFVDTLFELPPIVVDFIMGGPGFGAGRAIARFERNVRRRQEVLRGEERLQRRLAFIAEQTDRAQLEALDKQLEGMREGAKTARQRLEIDRLRAAVAQRIAGLERRPDPRRPDPEIERARRQLDAIRRETELAQRFGFATIADAPPALRQLLTGIKSAQDDTRTLTELLEKLGLEATGSLATYLEGLEDTELRLEALADLVRQNPDLLLSKEAAQARREVESLTAEYRILAELGFSALSQIPDPLREAALEVEGLTARLEDAERALEILEREGEARPEDRAGVEALRLAVERAIEVKAALLDVKDILQAFESFDVDILEGLTPEQVDAVTAAMRDLFDITVRVREARARLALAEQIGDQREIAAAARELNDALKARKGALQTVRDQLVAMGLSASQVERIIRAIADELDRAKAGGEGLAGALEDVARVGRGLLRIADAAGVLSDDLRRALEGAIDLADAVKDIATSGPSFANIAQGIGGAISLVSGVVGLFGSRETERQRKELIQALERLTSTLQAQAELVLGIPGKIAGAFKEVFESTVFVGPGGGNILGIERGGIPQELVRDPFEVVRRLRAQGLTGEDIRRLARELGIDLGDLANAMDGLGAKSERVADEIAILQDALDFQAVIDFFETWEGVISRMRREFEVFDIEDPIEQLERWRQVFLDFVDLPPELEARIAGFDLSKAEDRAAFERVMQEVFNLILADPRLAGDISVFDALDAIRDITNIIDRIQEEEGDGGGTQQGGIFRGASEAQFDLFLGVAQTQLVVLQDIAGSARILTGRDPNVPILGPIGLTPPAPAAPDLPTGVPRRPTPPTLPPPGALPPLQLTINASFGNVGPFVLEGADVADPRALLEGAANLTAAGMSRALARETQRQLEALGVV